MKGSRLLRLIVAFHEQLQIKQSGLNGACSGSCFFVFVIIIIFFFLFLVFVCLFFFIAI